MTVTELIPIYLQFCETKKHLDEKTRKAYGTDLRQLAEKVGARDVSLVDLPLLDDVCGIWQETMKPKTLRRKAASVRAFFRWLEETGYLETDPAKKLKIRIREPKLLPRTIPEQNLKRLLQAMYDAYSAADTERKKEGALRDITEVELLFGTGMRVSELCGLRKTDMNLKEEKVLIHGKGKKERIIAIPDDHLKGLLWKYESVYQERINRCGYYFINNRGNKSTAEAVRRTILKYTALSGIEQHITPHMFRHTFATSLLESDVNLRCIQEMLGHSSITTMEIYTHVSAAKQKEILKEHHPRKSLHIEAGGTE